MQTTLPTEMIFILLYAVLGAIIIGFYFYTGRNHKILEFKLVVIGSLSLAIVLTLVIIGLVTFQGDILFTMIFLPIAILAVIIQDYFLVVIVRENRIKLDKIIKTSSDVSLNVSNMASELAANASEVNASSEEIAATTQEVSEGARKQVNELKEINSISKNINSLALIIKDSSVDINGIMKIIINVAEQTNLLALNASIEAGRAGEHGRGFAVVADEVRKLAEESKTSVGNSSEKITSILRTIENAVKSIEEISLKIESTLVTSEETSAAMEEINSSAEEQTASMEEITSTSNRLGELAEELKEILKGNKHKSNNKTIFSKIKKSTSRYS